MAEVKFCFSASLVRKSSVGRLFHTKVCVSSNVFFCDHFGVKTEQKVSHVRIFVHCVLDAYCMSKATSEKSETFPA